MVPSSLLPQSCPAAAGHRCSCCLGIVIVKALISTVFPVRRAHEPDNCFIGQASPLQQRSHPGLYLLHCPQWCCEPGSSPSPSCSKAFKLGTISVWDSNPKVYCPSTPLLLSSCWTLLSGCLAAWPWDGGVDYRGPKEGGAGLFS